MYPQPSFTPSEGIRIWLLESGIPWWLQVSVAVFPYPKFYVVVAQAGEHRIQECASTNAPVPSFTPSEGIQNLLLESGIPWWLQVSVAVFPYPKFYVVVAQAGEHRIQECASTNAPVPSFTPSEGIRILLLESRIPLTTAGFCCRFSVSQILRRGRAGRTA